MAASTNGGDCISKELDSVMDALRTHKTVTVESCHIQLVHIKISHTRHKELLLKIQFPPDYPNSVIYIELKSSHISETLLNGMIKICEDHIKETNGLGSPQVLKACLFINEFLLNNPFAVCSEEVSHVKKSLYRDGDNMKVKSKAGVITYKAIEGLYFLEFTATVPFEYPSIPVRLEFRGNNNFPSNIQTYIKGQSEELLRQCVQPPARQRKNDPPFQPKPSLQVIFDFLLTNCVRTFPNELCPHCKEKALPPDPKNVSCVEGDPFYVYRMYCGHLYHHKCLDIYMKTPPFEGGKKCIKCSQRLSHEKWNVPPKVAEERWAHQEAKKREIAEVAEFLGFD